jgi:drug/metabolite transporter (DMT)-like permease
MPAIFFAFITFLAWGVGDLWVAVTARRLNPYSGTFWSMILTIVLFGTYIPFTLTDLTKLTPLLLLLNVTLGSILIGGIIAYREGFRVGNVALVTTIGSSFTAVTTILALIFFKERLSLFQTIAILTIFIGLFLSMFKIDEIKGGKVVLERGLIFGGIAMICWGIYFTFVKILAREIGWFWPNYITFSLFPLLYLFMKFRRIPILPPNTNKALKPLIASTIVARVAEFSFNIGISRGFTSIVAPIAGASPVLTVLLAFLTFKDPITKQQAIGIVVTLFGLVFFSIVSA